MYFKKIPLSKQQVKKYFMLYYFCEFYKKIQLIQQPKSSFYFLFKCGERDHWAGCRWEQFTRAQARGSINLIAM